MVEIMKHSMLRVKLPIRIQDKKVIKAGMRVLAMERVKSEFQMCCKGRSQRNMG